MRIPALALALLLPACIVGSGEIEGVGDDDQGGGGGGGGGGGDGSGSGSGSGSSTPTPKITASVDRSAITTELGKTENVVLTINSVNGFTGAVTLTPTVMDGATPVTGYTITATPPMIDLAADATATVTLAIKVPTDTASLAPTVKLDLASSAPAVTVDSSLAITNQYTITIPPGTGTAVPHAGLPAVNATLRLRMGAKVVFHNGDTISHQIHANGGIPHEANALAPGSDYIVTPSDNATWYCHAHESGTQARPILVQ
jgi:hypothetical protein